MFLGLGLVALLLAGCTGGSCSRIAVPSARSVPDNAPAVAGEGPVTMELTTFDEANQQPVPNTSIMAFWKDGDDRTSGSERRLSGGSFHRTGDEGFLLDPGPWLYLPANLTTLAVRTDDQGQARLQLPADRSVGLVYGSRESTEELALVHTPEDGPLRLELDVLPSTVSGSWDGSWSIAGPVDPGSDGRWEPNAVEVAKDLAFAQARFQGGTATLSWQDEPPLTARLKLAAGSGGHQDQTWLEPTATPPGKHMITGTLAKSFPLATSLQAGAAASGLQTAPLGGSLRTHVSLQLHFQRSSEEFHACLAPPPDAKDSSRSSVPLNGSIGPTVLGVLLFLGATAAAIVTVASRRGR